jgi:hypothetical protein
VLFRVQKLMKLPQGGATELGLSVVRLQPLDDYLRSWVYAPVLFRRSPTVHSLPPGIGNSERLSKGWGRGPLP